MAKRIRRVRTFARTATKSQEKHLIENAKQLRENPYIILPECTDTSCQKYFTKLHNHIEKIYRFKDNTDKLEKFASKKGLESALAGSLSLAISEKAPYLGVVKFPTGDVTFAHRGKAEREKLIAVQHFDDPVLRLLGIKDLVFKRKLFVYSWDNRFICTGRAAVPPEDFITFIIKKIGFPRKQNVVSCPHIAVEKAKAKDFLKHYYLRIHWKSADCIFTICENCSKATKNTMFTISKYMLLPDLHDDFTIEVIAQVVKQEKTEEMQETVYLDEYLSGTLTDREFIQKNTKHQQEQVEQSAEKILVLNGVSYGSDVKRFVDELKPNKYQREALEFILDRVDEPVVVSDASPNRILDRYWNQHGKAFIDAVVEDKTMADSFYKLDETPSNISTMVFEYKQRQHVLSQLPVFPSLPSLAKFADTVARTYKTFGIKNTLTEIKNRPENPKGRALAFAFLLALNKGQDSKWKYSKEEIEYGEFLKDYAQHLLDADPKKYRKMLQELLTASGSSEIVP